MILHYLNTQKAPLRGFKLTTNLLRGEASRPDTLIHADHKFCTL